MALSQIQCLDDHHVNPRTNESKPDFLYSEDQRLALEALLRDGRPSFVKFLEERQMRGFLSDLEQETLTGALEPYDPGSQLFPEDADENEPPLSLHYWPDLSDTSVPQMDLGWPHTEAYRGVTRTSVYTQPPLEGQTHIKEIVRKMIAQAQKVIAVVMDVFTDVDIFRDLIDAGFKRRVSIYILVESTTLPHFLDMCHRANMHAGHLKHLRVRCTEGSEFYTRSCTKVRGRLGHRFMFIDGDKAVSGSFSFTWMSSRLDKNLVTVITGQAVEAFDHLFRHLYMTSRFVDLRKVTTSPEPVPEPLPQPVPMVLPSTTVARNMYNPKYALLIGDNACPSASVAESNPKESQTPEVPDTKKRRRGRESQEEEFIHPGLINLEKACLISYVPTWPEPDPPKDVIGFINIMDTSKPSQVHLQRSERFETSQAIRFSSPFSRSIEILPEVVKPKEIKTEKTNPPTLQNTVKAEEPEYDKVQSKDPSSCKAENLELQSSASHAIPSQDDIGFQSSKNEHTKQTNMSAEYKTQRLESNKTHAPQLKSPADSNSGIEQPQTETAKPVVHSAPVHSTSLSDDNPIATTVSMAAIAPLSVNSSSFTLPILTSHFETVQSHLSSPSYPSSNPENVKPHTVHSDSKNGDIDTDGLSMLNTSTPNRPDNLVTKKADSPKSTGDNRQMIAEMPKNSNREIGVQKHDRNKQDNEAVRLHDGKAGTSCVSLNKKQSQPEATFGSTKESISDEVNTVDHDRSTKPKAGHGATQSRATAKQITRSKSADSQNENNTKTTTYHVKEYKPQIITYAERPPLSMWERIQAQTLEPTSTDVTSPQLPNNTTNSEKKNIRRATQESAQEQSPAQAPEKPQNVHLPDIQSCEKESRSAPDSLRKTQDFQTATSNMSDGYVSSNRSTTSEEYYECSGSPNQEKVFEKEVYISDGTTDTHPETTHSKSPNAAKTSSLVMDYSPYAALFGTKDKHTPSNESRSLDKKMKMKDKEVGTNKNSEIKNIDDKGRKLRSERDSTGKERRIAEQSKTTGSPKTVAKGNDTQAQTPMRKRALNPSTTETPVHKVLSRTPRPGLSNVQNPDGSALQVDGQKQSKSTAKPSRPASASMTQAERKAFQSTSQVFDYLSSFHKTSLEQPPS